MVLTRRIKMQLWILLVVSLVAGAVMAFGYLKLPALLFGVGHYTVTVELPQAAGLYNSGNVTYRGSKVGRVVDVRLTDTGVEAVLSLKSGIDIPSDLRAEVHSRSAIGEQYITLLPQNSHSIPLRTGDVIPVSRTSVPPDVNSLLDATNRGLLAIPRDNLKTVIDEGYVAVGGLGPEISRLVKGSTNLAVDARRSLDPLTALIDDSGPVLDAQAGTSDSIQGWAANLAAVTDQLRNHDEAVTGIIDHGGPAAGEVRQLVEDLQPTLPVVLANLVSTGEVAVTYRDNIEQLLVLVPQGVAAMQAGVVANLGTEQDYKGAYLSFHTNLNLPPVCATGFLPAQQRRVPTEEDFPDRPAGDIYCRIPQDSPLNVRGARNIPCVTVPGKRAPTVEMCESGEQYVPLSDGLNWKGDPNATLSGQDIPQLPSSDTTASASPGQAPPPIAAAEYDPATGTYIGPDGKLYTQANLSRSAPSELTWQAMLIPPTPN